MNETLEVLGTTVLFSLVGAVIFGLAFLVVVKITPFSVRKEIEDDQNTALAIVIGSVFIGLSIIIGASLHG
jgi:putative membrane protein